MRPAHVRYDQAPSEDLCDNCADIKTHALPAARSKNTHLLSHEIFPSFSDAHATNRGQRRARPARAATLITKAGS